MLTRRLFPVAIALSLVGIFAFGLLHLFRLRFERGDVFPPYSSLRTDPLGTKALHDALAEVPGIEVSRNYKPLSRLGRIDDDSTIMILGVTDFEGMTKREFNELKMLAASGHRVVVTMRSRSTKPRSTPAPEEKKEIAKEDDEDSDKTEEAPVDRIGIGYHEPKANLTALSAAPALPPEISWHSTAHFNETDGRWRYIYRVDERPVLMERRFGGGSIVLASDTWFLANEALRDDRHPELVAWIAGRHGRVIFDESHNGLSETEGVMTLVKKYNLRPLGFVIALLMGLFLWKSAVPFIPQPRIDREEEAVVVGKDSAAGFVNLLRRSVLPRDLLATCVGQWKHAFAHRAGDWKDRIAAMDAVVREHTALPPRKRDPVGAYRKITQILTAEKSR